MPELGPYGSVRGAAGNSRPYRERDADIAKAALMTLNGPAIIAMTALTDGFPIA